MKSHESELAWGDVIVNWNPYINSPLKEGDIGHGMIALSQNKFREMIMPKTACVGPRRCTFWLWDGIARSDHDNRDSDS